TQFYNNAKCGPTRASLLTGQYSQAVGESGLQRGVTLGEVLRTAGYRTLMTGKWHQASIPFRRGFDRHFGLADGCCNFFNPGPRREGEPEPGRKNFPRRWAIDGKEFRPWTPPKKFYTTDAFTDHAIRYLDEYKDDGKPFLLYVAYTAPHYPLHAWPEDIARYRGQYRKGWEVLREERFARMVKMGLVKKEWGLSPRDERSPKWGNVKDKGAWDLKMAVYAAMIDRMDQNIGRIVAKVKELGQEENTLVLFLADNGGCAESVNNPPTIAPGPVESYRTVELPWANASNTPFRKFKSWNHEGGVSTPLIACWPAVIKNKGGLTPQVGHIIDLMATCCDVAGAIYPTTFDGRAILPCEGKSLLPIFQGKAREPHDALYWQFGSARAVRAGKWKLVSYGRAPWELYDLEADRTELHNLADAQPDKAKELAALWYAWAKRVKARDPSKPRPKKPKKKPSKT
ncbi:arylsulfatase, partial [bacterium]|nr:arylsulfatase [bacterium]